MSALGAHLRAHCGGGRFWIARVAMATFVAACLASTISEGAVAFNDGDSVGKSKRASFADAFASPPTAVRPLAYWWLPQLDAITAEGIRSDISAAADAGIGGILPYRRDFAMPADARHRGLLAEALRAAKRQGIKLDLSLAETGTAPSVTADSGAAQQELVYGRATVAAGQSFNGALPAPTTDPDRPRSLVAVVAARCETTCDTAKPVLLVQNTVVDLTRRVRDGQLAWTAPAAGGQWVLLSLWARTAFYRGLPYADHLGEDGAEAITDYLDRHVVTPDVESLLDDAGGVLHEDSLHLGGYHLWSPELLSEFGKRRGYSLRKYLPISIIANLNDFFAVEPFGVLKHTDSPADFDFAGDAGRRIRNDYYQTLSELWEEKYVKELQRWARAHGLEFRAQVAYGQTFSTSTAARVDVPMVEAFQLGDTLDGYRSLAGPVHMGGRNVFSSECCVQVSGFRRDNYATTWKRMLSVIHNNFAAGVNQIVLHGVTYPDAPGATWPGFSNFDGIFGEEFGPRMPYWHHMPDLMDFLSREQLVLRQGQPRVDVAIYRQSYWDYGFPVFPPGGAPNGADCQFPAGCKFFNDRSLERAGYSYEFVGPALFDLPGSTVRNRRLSHTGPAYKALVINLGQRNDVEGMPLSAVSKVLSYARSGLPVVIVGDPPTGTGFFGDAGADSEVRATIALLLAQRSVRRVASEADVDDALKVLGVGAATQPQRPSNVLSFRRAAGDASYYFLWNQNRLDQPTGEPEPEPEDFDQVVSFEGRGRPFALDAWTGRIRPIASYERDGDHVTTRVRLRPGESTIIAIGPDDWQRRELGLKPSKAVHVTSTTADEAVVAKDGELRIRATKPGTYTTTLSNGRAAVSRIGELPSPRTLSNWHLSVEDWQPGATATETVKVPHELDLTSLRTWPEIPDLQDVSGIGRYTTQVGLDSRWTGARLELGPLFDSARLKVNGRSVGYIDADNPVLDVSRYLEEGTNTLEVEVATTLRNRVRIVRPRHAGFERQPYGLVGPVRLVPYGEAVIEPGRRRSHG